MTRSGSLSRRHPADGTECFLSAVRERDCNGEIDESIVRHNPSTARSGRNELWVMNADGRNERRISDMDFAPFPGRAAWQPVIVPEPATITLSSLGLSGILKWSARHRRSLPLQAHSIAEAEPSAGGRRPSR